MYLVDLSAGTPWPAIYLCRFLEIGEQPDHHRSVGPAVSTETRSVFLQLKLPTFSPDLGLVVPRSRPLLP